MSTSRQPGKFGFIGWIAAIILIIAGFVIFAFINANHEHRVGETLSPELRTFKEKYDQVEEEMTEEQVDSILAGHRSSKSREITEIATEGP